MPYFTGTITEPGLYPDVPEAKYHADPVPGGSLSSSGAKLLVPPSCPAEFDYQRRHGKHTRTMDKGTTVHGMVLGTGPEIAVLDFENRRTNDYKKAEAEALDGGKVPMLARDYAECRAIADAVFADPDARKLLDTVTDCELSGFWQDTEHGIWLRMRLDALGWDSRPRALDLKTAAKVRPADFSKSLAEYRYDMQYRHYAGGLAACLSAYPGEVAADDIAWSWIAVQTDPPYYVMVYEPSSDDIERADESLRMAYQTYAACSKAGVWPKWGSPVELSLPYYQQMRIGRDINDYYDH